MDSEADPEQGLSSFGLNSSQTTAGAVNKPPLNWGRDFGLNGATDAAPASKRKAKKAKKDALPEACTPDDILWREINVILGKDYVDQVLLEGQERHSPFKYHDEAEFEVVAMSSTGNGLAKSAEAAHPWVVAIPFVLPGEKVRARVYRNDRMYSAADLIEVLEPNTELRDDSGVQCKYFTRCGGCQYQMVPYAKQLELKRDVVVKAYNNYAEMPATAIPTIESTMPSPLQYNYRTKITPHFEAPNRHQKKEESNYLDTGERPEWFKIGFNQVGQHKVMDIEDCPIATPIINETLPAVRANAIKNLFQYKKGVSLILRDSLPQPDDVEALATDVEKHICLTDHRATARERVGSYFFEYPNGSFFQNNNCVLPSLTSYVESRIFDADKSGSPPPTHLVDAYCGAGLFAITLAARFDTVVGIELSAESIRAATRNAELNHIPSSKIKFQAGDATEIFRTVKSFPPSETVVVIDPPRKGCDWVFLKQLLAFGPRRVVYVSCNVHTQARDVGMMVNLGGYVLESVRGFDLFPQTAHVESVAVLRLE
ncbi:S-adenosyl-L-methionine-dependent methyltransferase [Mycena metata]|uniref:S-adenosyl-L-methionine-dependent methyltransferase n=1 Tax=Mycena metata TaxID=1033252 RepID=A0AAD7H8D1_9AGAR|nr:S-adenosyl-L-methionine-dependent methyltransferase [Mycena metata]